jgi:hypothetical protein
VKAVNQLTDDGRFILTLIKTEDLLLKVLEQIKFEDIETANMITLFQHICSQNFNEVVAKVFAHYNDKHPEYFELMLFRNEKDRNNALMEAAISESKEVLLSLLGFVSISSQANKYLHEVLHLKNKKKQTVLKIITSHGQEIQFYQVATNLIS